MTDQNPPFSTKHPTPRLTRCSSFAIAALCVVSLFGVRPVNAAEQAVPNAPPAQGAQPSDGEAAPAEGPKPVESSPVGKSTATPQPKITGPQIAEDVFYGPPAPKVKKGNLSQIRWTEPTRHVPPALEEAINIVTANYPSAISARAGLRAAASDVRAAKWLRFPSLNANVAYESDDNEPVPQITVDQPLWSGGRIESSIRRAKAQENVSSAQYVEVVKNLAEATAQAYFDVARLTQREQLLEESVIEHERLVRTMQRRYDAEISPLADLELAKSRLAQIEQEYTVTRSQRRTTLRVLAELIADPSYELGPMPHYDPDVDLPNRPALEDQAVAFDPSLQRLYAEADVARAAYDERKASIFPQLSAQYVYDEFFGSRVGVALRSQTTGGLSQFSEARSAQLRIRSALENTRATEQQLRRDIQTGIIQYEAAKERAAISKSAASTAGRVSASYTRQFIAGRRSWLDVMNALREAITAQIGQSDAEITVMSTATELLLQSGRWRPVFDDRNSGNDGFESLNGASKRGQ